MWPDWVPTARHVLLQHRYDPHVRLRSLNTAGGPCQSARRSGEYGPARRPTRPTGLRTPLHTQWTPLHWTTHLLRCHQPLWQLLWYLLLPQKCTGAAAAAGVGCEHRRHADPGRAAPATITTRQIRDTPWRGPCCMGLCLAVTHVCGLTAVWPGDRGWCWGLLDKRCCGCPHCSCCTPHRPPRVRMDVGGAAPRRGEAGHGHRPAPAAVRGVARRAIHPGSVVGRRPTRWRVLVRRHPSNGESYTTFSRLLASWMPCHTGCGSVRRRAFTLQKKKKTHNGNRTRATRFTAGTPNQQAAAFSIATLTELPYTLTSPVPLNIRHVGQNWHLQ